MTNAAPPGTETTRATTRRTAVLLLAWLAAAAVAGLPDDSAGAANAKPRTTQIPIVNTGPECFAGHAAAPAPSKGRD
jgi:hypothetical protein